MSLTDDEQLRLNEIEMHLHSSDPMLSRRLGPSFNRAGERRRLIRCALLLMLGTAIMVAGAAGVTGVFSYGTLFALLGFALMALAVRRARDLNPPPDTASIR